MFPHQPLLTRQGKGCLFACYLEGALMLLVQVYTQQHGRDPIS